MVVYKEQDSQDSSSEDDVQSSLNHSNITLDLEQQLQHQFTLPDIQIQKQRSVFQLQQIDSTQNNLRRDHKLVRRNTLIVAKYICKQRILVVDDDPMNLFAISHNLKMALRNMGRD